MAGADGVRWAEADSANMPALKRGLNNIADVNKTGGQSGRLIIMLMLLKGLNECYWRCAHLRYVRAERAFIGRLIVRRRFWIHYLGWNTATSSQDTSVCYYEAGGSKVLSSWQIINVSRLISLSPRFIQ